MKNISITLLMIILLASIIVKPAQAQANEAAQLALNIEKLAQLKSILKTLKTGFDIVSKGYNTVKSLTEGNFNLHKVFLDGLMQISPAVKKYQKIPQIIDAQITLVKETKIASRRILNAGVFNQGEANYMLGVYNNLVSGSLKNIDDLIIIITANKLRMTDDERLSAIDKLYADMADKVEFIRYFNEGCSLLAIEKKKQLNQVTNSEALFGIKN